MTLPNFRIEGKVALVTGGNRGIVSKAIRVNAIAPGCVVFNMVARGMAGEKRNKIWMENTPMVRSAQPEEMATCALLLASLAASYVTGTVLVADGGYTTH